ncbi:hypothetical protein V8F06_009901 [Rhypophila decipiens]
MKFAVSALASLATLVTARNCLQGLIYCGFNLRAIAEGNNYDAEILEAMALEGYSDPTWDQINNALFFCDGSSRGHIIMIKVCTPRCVDGGENSNDYSASGGRSLALGNSERGRQGLPDGNFQ